MSAADVLSQLPELSWRGITVPCEVAPFDFAHVQAERPYPYVDAAGHDNTGRAPLRFNTRLFFLKTLRDDLFPLTWESWSQAAIFDGSADDLVHPLLGTVRARVLQGHVALHARTRDGVIVDCTWTETVDEPDQPNQFGGITTSIDKLAAAADAAATAAGISYPDGTGSSSLLDAYNSIKGQIGSAINKVTGAINSQIGIISGMIDDVDALDDALMSPAHDALVGLWNAYQNLNTAVQKSKPRPTAKVTVTSNTTLDAFASDVGNSLDDIMSLNVSALRSPTVKAGTTLTYYK